MKKNTNKFKKYYLSIFLGVLVFGFFTFDIKPAFAACTLDGVRLASGAEEIAPGGSVRPGKYTFSFGYSGCKDYQVQINSSWSTNSVNQGTNKGSRLIQDYSASTAIPDNNSGRYPALEIEIPTNHRSHPVIKFNMSVELSWGYFAWNVEKSWGWKVDPNAAFPPTGGGDDDWNDGGDSNKCKFRDYPTISSLSSTSAQVQWETKGCPSVTLVVYGQPEEGSEAGTSNCKVVDNGDLPYVKGTQSLEIHKINIPSRRTIEGKQNISFKPDTVYFYQAHNLEESTGKRFDSTSYICFRTKKADGTGGDVGNEPPKDRLPPTTATCKGADGKETIIDPSKGEKCPPGTLACISNGESVPVNADGTCPTGESVGELYNPIKSNTLVGLALWIMKLFLGGVAALAIVFMVMGSFRLVVSRGIPESVTRGKDILVWSVAGLAVALMGFSLVSIVQNLLGAY